MKRYVLLVLAIEVLVGGYLVWQRMTSDRPPMPDFAYVDELTAQQLRDHAARCRTADDWQALGDAYMAVGYFPEAEACQRVAAAKSPNEAKYALAWAFALERLGQTSDANREYRRAITLGHARKGDCQYYIGRNLLREEKPDEAQHEFESASTVPFARYELARLHVRANRLDDAQWVLKPLLTDYPDTIQPALLRHRIAHLQGDAKNAFLYADHAMTAKTRLPNPFDKDFDHLMATHAKLGLVGRWKEAEKLVQNKRFDKAEPLLRDGLKVLWHPTGADLLAEVEFQRGAKSAALTRFREIIDRDGPSAYNVSRLADSLSESGQEAAARSEWLRAAKLGSAIEAKDVYYKLAVSFEKAKDTTQQKKYLADALRCAAEEQLRLRAEADADGLLQQAFVNEPNAAATWYLRGEVARRLNQREAAIKAYQACLRADPHHGRAAAALAFLQGG